MGLFSNLRSAAAPARSPSDDTARAIIAMPLLVAAADGKIDEAELIQIVNMCAFNPLFHAIGAERTRALIQENLATLRAKGAEHLFASVVDSLSPRLRETALCFAIRTALADGQLEDSEFEMLKAMGMRMGVPAEAFGKMFEVMAMLQRFKD
jgi:tellurite resistance protein